MPTMKRIAVGTDLSWYARRAETRAAMLARELGSAELDLVHVIGSLALESLRHLLTQPPEQTERRLIDSAKEQIAMPRPSTPAWWCWGRTAAIWCTNCFLVLPPKKCCVSCLVRF